MSLALNNLCHFLGLFDRRQIDDIFLIFSKKIGFDIPCKLSPNLHEMPKPILGDNMHVMSKLIFWDYKEKERKKISMSSAENFTQHVYY